MFVHKKVLPTNGVWSLMVTWLETACRLFLMKLAELNCLKTLPVTF